ncbi:MAG: hypothetical protein R6W71_00570 [Bacteroidales bacterium]
MPYNSARLILAGPTLDITFTDKVFLSTFVQYNNQIDNLNMNTRFQWRFAFGTMPKRITYGKTLRLSDNPVMFRD